MKKIDFGQFIDQFNRLELKIRVGAFAGILFLIFLLDFFTVMGFQLGLIKKAASETKTVQDDIQRLQTDMLRIDQMKASLQKSKLELESMNMKIRPVEEISSILDDISRLANESEVKLDQLNPQSEAQQSLIAGDDVKYSALPIVVQATSSYHNFGHFINKLEQGKLYFVLANLTIEDKSNDIHNHLINATIEVILSNTNLSEPPK